MKTNKESVNKETSEFETYDLYLAAFLISRGNRLSRVSTPDKRGRVKFVFDEFPDRDGQVKAFDFADVNDQNVLVDSRMLINAIKDLKTKVHRINTNEDDNGK